MHTHGTGYASRLDRKRALCSNLLVILRHFRNLAGCIHTKGINPQGIIKGDENDFLMSRSTKQSLLIVRAGQRNPLLMAAIKPKLITVIEVICSDDFNFTALCITKAESLQNNWTIVIKNLNKET